MPGSRVKPQEMQRARGSPPVGSGHPLRYTESLDSTEGKVMGRPDDEGHRANGAPKVETQNQRVHFANEGDDGKAQATMKARAALAGCTLHELADGGYLVSRWNYSKAVPCLQAVGDLLRQIGGRS